MFDLVRRRVIDVEQYLVNQIGTERFVAVATRENHEYGFRQRVVVDLLKRVDKLF
jgi:hypothetical protein